MKREIEKALGFNLSSLVRLKGGSSVNYRAERATDGFRFIVKLTPRPDDGRLARLRAHLDEMKGTKAVQRIFPEAQPLVGDYDLTCLALCPGVRKLPDQLTADELRALAEDYQAFSQMLQRASLIRPPFDYVEMYARVRRQINGPLAARILRMLERHLSGTELCLGPSRIRVIHGDFHQDNFFFDRGRIGGIFDLEEFHFGYPTEDLARYFICAAEHLRFFERFRVRRLLANFRAILGHFPYSRDEWMTAIGQLELRKAEGRADRKLGFFKSIDLLWRLSFYERLRDIVRERRTW